MKYLIRFNGRHPLKFGGTDLKRADAAAPPGRERYYIVAEVEATFFDSIDAARLRARDAGLKQAMYDVFPVTPDAEFARFKRDHPLHGQPMFPNYTGD
jgi:hypothetical protein